MFLKVAMRVLTARDFLIRIFTKAHNLNEFAESLPRSNSSLLCSDKEIRLIDLRLPKTHTVQCVTT